MRTLTIGAKRVLTVAAGLALSSCNGGGSNGDSAFAFLNAPVDGTVVCGISNSVPEATTLTASAVESTATTFTVGLTRSDCAVTYTLNDTPLDPGGAAVTILSGALRSGENTIVATVGTTSRKWILRKNQAPTCTSQTPDATRSALAPGASLTLTGSGADADNETIQFHWKVNGATVAASLLSPFDGKASSRATFTPDTTLLGVNTIELRLSDGIDETSCRWTVGVSASCTIASTMPNVSSGPIRVPFSASASTPFSVSSDPACLIHWELNSVPLTGTDSAITLSSSSLQLGSNTLTSTVTNGTSSETKTWSVVKNSPPTCATQTPNSTGTTVGVSSSVSLTAAGSDLNADALNYTWKDNGVSAPGSMFSVTSSSDHSTAVFSPLASSVGAHTIRADISDGYDTTACSWIVEVAPTCQIASSTPTPNAVRVANFGTTPNSFAAVANDPSCAIAWTVNGTSFGGTSPFATLPSSALTSGLNTVVATATNGFSSTTRTWNVTKNVPPTCSSQLPVATGTSVGVGSPLVLTANGADSNGDPITFAWKLNGAVATSPAFSTTATASAGQAVWTPTAAGVGPSTVTAEISDGLDSTACTWNLNVVGGCTVASSLPPTTTVRVPHLDGTSNAFTIVPNQTDCAVSWSLNGVALPTGNFASVLSSALLDAPASNALVATLNNGYTAPTTRTWAIAKNRLPVCLSQTPSATPPYLAYQNTRALTANAADADGDLLSGFQWTFNGAPASTLFTPVTTLGSTSTTTFRPTSASVGIGQTVRSTFSDGLDTNSCVWNFDVIDPSVVTITSCTPASPLILASTGLNSTQSLAANAAGTGLTYKWYRDASEQAGSITASYAISSSTLSLGIHNFQGLVTDTYNNSVHCDWVVKVNAPPVVTTTSPNPAIPQSVGASTTLNFSVAASDANSGDTLTYAWTVDNQPNAALPSGSASTTFTPAGSSALVGTRTIAVTVSDGTESVSRSWTVNVIPTCAIGSATPAATAVRVPAAAITSNTFAIIPNDATCALAWTVNGVPVSGTDPVRAVLSSSFGSGANTVSVVATNAYSSATRTWNITKNSPPVCASQVPAAAGSAVGVANPIVLTANGTDVDSDPISFTWRSNGAAVNLAQFTLSSTGTTGQATFRPTAAYIGSNTVTADLNDGFDTTSCTWSVNVVGGCTVASSLPATTTLKVANAGSTTTAFAVVPSSSDCTVSWNLNGTTLTPGQFASITSSDLLDGPASNTLVATLSNGYTASTTRTWAIAKNRAPICASQIPVTNPPGLAYASTRAFTANASDADGDALTGFGWQFNGITSGTLFTPITTTGNQSVTTFRPTLANVGTGQTITARFTDGYDPGVCTWSLDVLDPNTVNITSCSPASSLTLASTGAASTATLTTNATGTGLTYQWLKNTSVQGGFTTPTLNLSSSSLSIGSYAFQGLVTDSYNNSAHCDWTVKVNAPPVLSNPLPIPGQSYRLGINSTRSFSVTGTDANVGDTLTYSWTLDGATSSTLPSGSSTTTFSPAGASALIGAHTILVTVSDGVESATQSWTVEVNSFSQACNDLYNSPVGTSGGYLCTLVGIPTIGNGQVPSADQTLMRIRPNYAIDDGAGNLIFSDILNNSVHYFNRSASAISRFGISIPAGKMVTVLGNGANGITPDSLFRTDFKLDFPMDLAFDAGTGRLFVADYNNHRVVMMNNTGLVTTVFGITGSATNSLIANTDGNAGTTQGCGNPVGLKLVNVSGSLWLYVACSSTNLIKKMVADAGANFGKGYVVVGRLASGISAAGNGDGAFGPAGDAQLNLPWALATDDNLNLYWTENNGYRVRMATTSGSAASYFTAAYTPSNAFTVAVSDVAGIYTATSMVTQAVSVSAAETQVKIDGPSTAVTNVCTPFRARILNASNATSSLSSASTISLAGAGTGGNFYANSTCSTPLVGGNIAMAAGSSEANFYYLKTSAGSATLFATGNAGALTAYPLTGLAVTVGSTAVATTLAISGPSSYDYTACAKFVIQARSAGGQASTPATAKTLRLAHNATGNFYADAACATAPISQITLGTSASEISVYFARTVVAPAGSVVSLFGNASVNGVYPTTSTLPASVGLVTLRNPRGLVVSTNGSGVVKGFYVTNYDQYRMLYVNNSTSGSLTIGGTAVPAQLAGVVLGTGTAGFNTDGLGNITRTYTGYGLSMDPGQTKILYPDFDNYRLREFDTNASNGQITTVIGAGRSRSGNLGDSPLAAPAMYLNSPSQLAMDNTNRKLYISDSGNGRIRRVDMLTGSVDTIIGKGIGGATVEDEDPTNVLMNGPRAMALMTSGGLPFLVYADQSANTAQNTNCMVRAMNMSTTSNASSFFGTAIQKGRVTTIAGEYTHGCEPWNFSTPNTNGMSARNAQLYNPEGLATDGTNLYVALYNDHCIAKITPDGSLSSIIGTCGTAGALDGNTTVATLNLPTAIVVDPLYAADGNLFIADAPNSTPSRVRYVNYRTSAVTIAGNVVPAAPGGGVGIVQTLWTVSPSGNSNGRVFGLAAFGSQLCMAGGAPGAGQVGSHNVSCYDRSSAFGNLTIRIGPNEVSGTPTRGGAPLDYAQEGIFGASALLSAPYGLTFDAAGNLYVSERNNHIVRMVRRWY